jgi:pimeloyl-ACP methyl ester carboxylesterase
LLEQPRATRVLSRMSDLSIVLIATAIVFLAAAVLALSLARQAEEQHPSSGRFLTVNGVRLHYTDSGGEGAPVVLIHGNTVTFEDWQLSGVSAKAEQRYRVIAFDRPGFGYSQRPRLKLWTPGAQADLIHQALASLGVTRAIIVGHSFGALVAVALAIRHPRLVRGLVAASGYYFPTFRLDALMVAPQALPVVGDLFRYTLSPLVGRVFAPLMMMVMFAPQLLPPRFVPTFLGLSIRPWQIRAAVADGSYMVPAAMSLRGRYREIGAPTQIIAGNNDKIVSPSTQSDRLHGVIRQSKLRILPWTGHMVHYAMRDAVMEAIDEVAVESGVAPSFPAVP